MKKTKLFQMRLSNKELEIIDKIKEEMHFDTRAELIRHLIRKYAEEMKIKIQPNHQEQKQLYK